MRIFFLTFMSGLMVSSITAIEKEQFFLLNEAIVFNHILPRYEKFSKQTYLLNLASIKFCKSPSKSTLPKIKKAFHTAADSWASIQHIQFGPIEEKLRHHRIFYWPDKHSIGSRHMRRMLKKKNDSKLKPEKFSLISVALQGFPALERLLFSQSENLFNNDINSKFRCDLVKAISNNLHQISSSILNEWENQIKELHKDKTSTNIEVYNRDGDEIFKIHISSLYGSLRSIHELKLRRILGETPNDSHPRRTEAWRSERSLRNIILNLEALNQFFQGEGGFGMEDLIERKNPETKTAKDFKTYLEYALKTAKQITLPLHKAVLDPTQFEQVDRLKAQILTLIGFVRARIPAELGLGGPGFNYLDGD